MGRPLKSTGREDVEAPTVGGVAVNRSRLREAEALVEEKKDKNTK
jgi:hypothetical protein